MQFVQHVADHYLTCEHKEVRLEGVRTCCHLLRPTFATLSRRASQSQKHTVFNIVSKILWVSVTDMGTCVDADSCVSKDYAQHLILAIYFS